MLAHVVILPYGGEGRRIRSSKSSLDYYEQHKLHETLSKKGNENILIHFHSFGFSNAFLSQQHRHTPGERRLLPGTDRPGRSQGRRAAYVQKLRRWKIDPLLQSESWKKVNIDSAPHKMGGFGVSCSPGWRQIYYVDKNSLEPLILLPLSPNSLNCRHDSMPGIAFKILLIIIFSSFCVCS